MVGLLLMVNDKVEISRILVFHGNNDTKFEIAVL